MLRPGNEHKLVSLERERECSRHRKEQVVKESLGKHLRDGEKFSLGISLVVQWLGHHAANSGTWIQSLVRELDPICCQLKRFSKPQLRPSTAKHTHTLKSSLV